MCLWFNGNIFNVIVVYFFRIYPNMIVKMGHTLCATESENDDHKPNMPAEAWIYRLYCQCNPILYSYNHWPRKHYNDVITIAMASQITSLTIVYSTVYSSADQRKHQSCASLAFVWGIHRWPVSSPHKGPVTRKMFPFDDVIMSFHILRLDLTRLYKTSQLTNSQSGCKIIQHLTQTVIGKYWI